MISSIKAKKGFPLQTKNTHNHENQRNGKTAQFWVRYMDIIQIILTFIRATKENGIDTHIAYDHTSCAGYVLAYLMTPMDLSDTHPGCKELLEPNRFSVSRPSFPCTRNAVDITIEQTIYRHAKLGTMQKRLG